MGEFEAFLHSSLSCAGSEVVTGRLQGFLADTGGHIGLAISLTLLVVIRRWSRFWVLGFLIVVSAKELAFDLPNAEWSTWVMVDSAWDAFTYIAGVAFVFAVLAPVAAEVPAE